MYSFLPKHLLLQQIERNYAGNITLTVIYVRAKSVLLKLKNMIMLMTEKILKLNHAISKANLEK